MSMLTKKDINPEPITAAEVENWFRATTKRRRLPDAQTCETIATMLQNWRAGGWRHDVAAAKRWLDVDRSPESEKERQAWDKAVGTLRARMDRVRQAADSGTPTPVDVLLAISGLEDALLKADGWFGRLGKQAPRIIWHEIAQATLNYYQQAFSLDGGPIPGISSPTGPAVRFTKSALERLGFKEATPAAIAEQGRAQSNAAAFRSAGNIAPK